ncbi:response regulator [Pseudogracilibacillus auburnensis]|uniref:response regulator n=1 Tax=Pseudogracilibacillus auburnensis TaxID=1494959 RepID=UPI001A969EBC|nr:response regulator [Pseudogracilibacillus auburnensis]MBO1004768.1 response regulator [Pseudogracilibacillus auburnensis]
MLKLVIVDDDKIARKGLKQFIEWDMLGYKVVRTLPSAEEALEYLKENSVDVVLTDIVMDEKNGIDLVREASGTNEKLKFILLSGHGEFHYAKEAMKLGVFDYLTKPVNFDELHTTFLKLKDAIQQEKLNILNNEKYRSARIGQLFNNLVSNGYGTQTVETEEMTFLFQNKAYRIFRVYINPLSETQFGKDVLEEDFYSLLRGYPNSYLFNNRLSEYALFVSEEYVLDVFSKMNLLIEKAKKEYNLSLSVGIGKEYSSISSVAHSYREAGEALAYRYFLKDNSIIDYNMIENQKSNVHMPVEFKEKIVSYIMNEDIEGLKSYMKGLIDINFSVISEDMSIFHSICLEGIRIIKEFLESRSPFDLFATKDEVHFMYKIMNKKSLEELVSYMNAFIDELYDSLRRMKNHSNNILVDNVRNYIDDHYGEALSLQTLGDEVYVHPTYLSTLFKQKTGENVLQYITKVRIEKAKVLLRDLSLRVYDVSNMVGYESPKHFTKVFKAFTGITPTEFRNHSTD